MESQISVFSRASNKRSSLEEYPSHITEFLNNAKAAKENLSLRQELLEKKLAVSEQFIDIEISKIHNLINYFQTILDHTDAQAWRTAAECLQKEGKQQAEILQSSLSEIKKSIQNTCSHLETSSHQVIKSFTKNLNGLNTGEIEQLAEDNCQEVKNFAGFTTKKILEISRWFYWRNLSFVICLSLFVVFLTDLLIDGEWPWEINKTPAKWEVTHVKQ